MRDFGLDLRESFYTGIIYSRRLISLAWVLNHEVVVYILKRLLYLLSVMVLCSFCASSVFPCFLGP